MDAKYPQPTRGTFSAPKIESRADTRNQSRYLLGVAVQGHRIAAAADGAAGS
jgi:hypothetical protein